MSASANLHAEGETAIWSITSAGPLTFPIICLKENAIWLALIAPIQPSVADRDILFLYAATVAFSFPGNDLCGVVRQLIG